MFVLTPVSALHPYTYHIDPYVARQRARTEARIRKHRQEQLRNQLILDALRAHEYANSPFYDYGYDPVCPAFDYGAAIQEARRQAVLEQAAREREARYEDLKRLAALKAHHEEQARRRANAERFLSMLLDPQNQARSVCSHSCINSPSDHLSQFQEIAASTSKAPIQDEPSLKHSLEERLTNERESDVCDALRSLLSSVSGVNLKEAPVEVSTPTNHTVPEQEIEITAPIPSEGKGKGKELPQSDSEDEPSPAQVSSSLSQISAIASRLETLLANFQFPAELDFSPERSPSPSYSTLDTNDEYALTYTPVNAPLRAQEHALSLLLSELDTVPSFGSHVVKDARRAVVMRVEQALEELEKGVEERRGRARARKADPVAVVESVQVHDAQSPVNAETADSMDVDTGASPLEPGSVDLAPTPDTHEVPSNVSESVDASITDASAEGSVKVSAETGPMELYNTTEHDSSQTTIEASSSISFSIGLSNASVTEPSVVSSTSISTPASVPTAPSVSEIPQASAPQDELLMEPEELLVDVIPPTSEKAAGEDMVVIERIEEAEDVDLATRMEVEPSSYIPHPEVNPGTSDSLLNDIPVSSSVPVAIPHSVPVPPSGVLDATDSAVERPAHSSPSSEPEAGNSLYVSHPVSPCLVPRNSEDEDGVVVGYEHESERENEDEWSHVEA